MIVCHVCGTENADSNKYCEGCGVELQAQAGAPVAAVSPASSPTLEAQPAPEAPALVTAPAASDVVATVGTTVQGSQTMDEILAAGAASASSSPAAPASSSPAAVETPELAPLPEAAAPTPESTPTVSEAAVTPEATPTVISEPVAPVAVPTPIPATPVTSGNPVGARLIPRQFGALTNAQFPLNGDRLVVGRFDPSTGPVDIDLTGLPGDSHVSRRHGEMFLESGKWMVRDLGSTNGIYVKRAGEDKFGPRLQAPASVGNGDEIAFGNVMFVYREGSEA